MPIKPGGMLLTGIEATIPLSVEPWSFGGVVGKDSVEPFNFGDASNAFAVSVESWSFGANSHADSVEPYNFGSNSHADSVEPFDFGSSGGTRGGPTGTTIVPNLGTVTPSPASPLMGWRDR